MKVFINRRELNHCVPSYFDEVIFERLVKEFIVNRFNLEPTNYSKDGLYIDIDLKTLDESEFNGSKFYRPKDYSYAIFYINGQFVLLFRKQFKR